MSEVPPSEPPAETPQIPPEKEWPIRAEIALPSPDNLPVNGGRLTDYQTIFTRIMLMMGMALKDRFGSAIRGAHEQTGTIDVVGTPDIILQILRASRGKTLAFHHHWEENSVNHVGMNGDDTPSLPVIVLYDGSKPASPSEPAVP